MSHSKNSPHSFWFDNGWFNSYRQYCHISFWHVQSPQSTTKPTTSVFMTEMPQNGIPPRDPDGVHSKPKISSSSGSVRWLLFSPVKLVPLQASGELAQGLQEVWGSGGGLLAEALPSPAQLPLLDVAVLNLPEQLRHHLWKQIQPIPRSELAGS